MCIDFSPNHVDPNINAFIIVITRRLITTRSGGAVFGCDRVGLVWFSLPIVMSMGPFAKMVQYNSSYNLAFG